METLTDVATILVADDERGLRESFRMILKNRYNVVTVENGKECIESIKTKKPDLVICDIRMPDMDGIEVLREVKKIDPSIPIIMITAVGTHQIAIEALKHGASDFIAKPVSIQNIREVVENTLLESAYKKGILNIDKAKGNLPSIDDILKKSYLDTLKSLTKIIEKRDPYTREHSKTVAKYAVAIAKEMGLSNEEIEVMEQTSLLHDIGKIGISDLILHKSDKLTDEEWEIIKKHPKIAEEILQPLQLLHIEQSMICHHHERYDGKGYPDGLKGNNIPIYARILTLADAYAAMTSERPYRKPLSHVTAVEEIKKNSGTQFDPVVVEAFLKISDKLDKNE